MAPTSCIRLLSGWLLVFAVIVFGAPWSPSHVVSAQDQTLFLSVTDASGDPVTDLTADALIVRWDGEDCETLDVEPINWPVRITVFVDNEEGGREALQDMREGLKLFVDEIPEEVEIALATIAGRPRFVTRHTSDREDIARGIDLIVPDAGASARFRDSLIEEGERLDDDDERRGRHHRTGGRAGQHHRPPGGRRRRHLAAGGERDGARVHAAARGGAARAGRVHLTAHPGLSDEHPRGLGAGHRQRCDQPVLHAERLDPEADRRPLLLRPVSGSRFSGL